MPLDTVHLRLRRLALDRLSPLQETIFRYVFPVFDEAPVLAEFAQWEADQGKRVERPFNYRRYAAGPELPRGCYATICEPGRPHDDGTLVGELIAYSDPRRAGECYIFDGTDSRVTGEDPRMLGSFDGYCPAPTSIVIAFASRPTRLHPLLDPDENPLGDVASCQHFRRTAPISDRLIALLEVPTTIEDIRCEKVIDLRKPSHQEWLVETSRKGLYQTLFGYPRPIADVPVTHAGEFVPPGYPLALRYLSPRFERVLMSSRDLTGQTSLTFSPVLGPDRRPDTFKDLLPLLMAPGRGGSPVTEALGATFRASGAQGLIYPSARSDVFCVTQREKLIHTAGWCFVDYRAFDVPRPFYRVIVDPAGWCSPEPLDVHVIPPGHPEAGSWKLTGIRDREVRRHNRRIEEFYENPPATLRRALRRMWRGIRSTLHLGHTETDRLRRPLGLLPGFEKAVERVRRERPDLDSSVWEFIARMRCHEQPRRVRSRLVRELVPVAIEALEDRASFQE